MSSEPKPLPRVDLYKGPFEFVPGDWYRTLGPTCLWHYSPDMVEVVMNGLPSRIPAGSHDRTYGLIFLPKKTDVLLIDVRPFDIQVQLNIYVRLLQLVFLVETQKYTCVSGGGPGTFYSGSLISISKPNWKDPVYDYFRPSKYYPNFCHVMYDRGNPRKRAGANLAGLKERIKM